MASRIFGLLGMATALFTNDTAAAPKERKHPPKGWMPIFKAFRPHEIARPLTDRPKVRNRKMGEQQMKQMRADARRKYSGPISAETKIKLSRGADYRKAIKQLAA